MDAKPARSKPLLGLTLRVLRECGRYCCRMSLQQRCTPTIPRPSDTSWERRTSSCSGITLFLRRRHSNVTRAFTKSCAARNDLSQLKCPTAVTSLVCYEFGCSRIVRVYIFLHSRELTIICFTTPRHIETARCIHMSRNQSRPLGI